MKTILKPGIDWVGKIDWELRQFHGFEYATHRGSTYNSYLVRDEKTVLIDTVWLPFAKEFVSNLQKKVDLQSIDAVVINHAEIDHSGALGELMRLIPNIPIYCTANGVKSIQGHFHQNWNFKSVKTGDRLSLGRKELIFIEAPMLHWPDTQFCYLTEDHVLFSNDAFGQHYASEHLFADEVDPSELEAEAIKYFANILTPFSPLIMRKIQELQAMGVPVDMICPSHGMIWKNPAHILDRYLTWSNRYQENQITIVYDTMWNGTRRMAEEIAKGISLADPSVAVKLYHAAKTDKSDVLTEVFKSKAILIGSPTLNQGILTSIAGLLEEMRGLKFQGKQGAVFGCYGWAPGVGTKILSARLREASFAVSDDGIQAQWNPADGDLDRCVQYGRTLGENWGKRTS